MPEYHFTGASPRVLTGLSQGVNALLLPADRPTPPHGSTIEAHPGDSLETNEPYAHPELEEVVYGAVEHIEPPEPTAEQLQEAVPDVSTLPAPEPVADPAPADMTAEGAPAPAEPTN